MLIYRSRISLSEEMIEIHYISSGPPAGVSEGARLSLQVLTLHQKCDSLQDQLHDLSANLGEVREQATHRFASEAERLQDQTEMLFSAWSEGLKDELEGKQHRLNEKIHGDQLAFEIRLKHVEQTQETQASSGQNDYKPTHKTIHLEVEFTHKFCRQTSQKECRPIAGYDMPAAFLLHLMNTLCPINCATRNSVSIRDIPAELKSIPNTNAET